MGSGLSKKYTNTFGSQYEDSGVSEVREEIAEYNARSGILRASTGTSNINDNAGNMTGKFAPNEYGNFGRLGKTQELLSVMIRFLNQRHFMSNWEKVEK